MNKFAINYEELQANLNKKKKYKLADVQDKIVKIGFDVVRFMDSNDNIDGLWQIQHADDGDYIVAMYENEQETIDKKSNWNVVLDNNEENINIFYKNTPIHRMAVSSLNIDKKDVSFVCRYLPQKLANNNKLVSSLMSGIPQEWKKQVLQQHPELHSQLKG